MRVPQWSFITIGIFVWLCVSNRTRNALGLAIAVHVSVSVSVCVHLPVRLRLLLRDGVALNLRYTLW